MIWSRKLIALRLSISGVKHISQAVCVCSVVSESFETSWTVARQAPLSMLSFPSPGDRPRDQSHTSGVFCFGQWILCNLEPPGKPKEYLYL